jgi:hypothetical protein
MDTQSPSWVPRAQALLTDYNLPSILDILRDPPKKHRWNRLTRKAVTEVWENRLKEQARIITSLSHLVVDNCHLEQTHRSLASGRIEQSVCSEGISQRKIAGLPLPS